MIKFFSYSDYAAARDAGHITVDQPVKLVGHDPQEWRARYEESRRYRWRTDMENAPQDGTPVLVSFQFEDDAFPVCVVAAQFAKEKPLTGFWWRDAGDGCWNGDFATHWMPLVPAPSRQKEDA